MSINNAPPSTLKRKLTALIEATTPIKKRVCSTATFASDSPEKQSSRSTYNPWSRPQLLSRLSTFKSCYWETEDQYGVGLTPIDCVQLGWVCVGFMMLKCVQCGSLLSVKLPTVEIDGDTSVYEKVCARYRKDILVNHHRQGCLWRLQNHQKASDVDSAQKGLYYDGLSITADVITQLQEDYKKLVEYSKVLPEPAKNDDEKLFEDETKNLFKTRLLGIPQSSSPAFTESEAAIDYVLHGWEIFTAGEAVFVKCSSCFRKVLLLNQGKPVFKNRQINLVEEHKSYCSILISWPQTLRKFFQLSSTLANNEPHSLHANLKCDDSSNSNGFNDTDENGKSTIDRAERLKRIKNIFTSPVKTKPTTPVRAARSPLNELFSAPLVRSTSSAPDSILETPTKERKRLD
ncbi:conserved hypothetical protein [Geotrichum candidum]|uniref:C3HC-type domain-containing protein n=1 Tax=Geotrichum candidum TaxID=1173061 RepID=A0A0J9XAT0_GEOCN|nr:conserved hypothetical protein [Geotrichum candidum]